MRQVCWYHPDVDTPELREKLESLGLEPQPNRHVPKDKMYAVDIDMVFHETLQDTDHE